MLAVLTSKPAAMPELPEVEITRRGIEPHVSGQRIGEVVTRHLGLRYPFPPQLRECLIGQRVTAVRRRAKYISLDAGDYVLLLHLGMSGSLRIFPRDTPAGKHDHFDLVLGEKVLRLRDPRRFGAVLLLEPPAEQHALLATLGCEPLADDFDGEVLYAMSRGRRTPIKPFIMDAHRIVGVGNIYASESLFRARIHPATPAGQLNRKHCRVLADAIKQTLQDALAAGGSSLKDFVHSDGASGYFQQQYAVYGRDCQPCRVCGATVERHVMAQRATFCCPVCQKTANTRGISRAKSGT